MDIKDTIKNNLNEKAILEYPVFYFALPENVQRYREQPYLEGNWLGFILRFLRISEERLITI